MKQRKIIAIIAFVLIGGLVFFRLSSNKKSFEDKIYRFDAEAPVSVKTDTIALGSTTDRGAYTGTFEPFRETKISTEVQGKINSIYVDAGSYVRQGQTLIQLDNSLLKLQLQGVEVQIRSLQKDIDRYTILTEADAIQGVQLEKTKSAIEGALVQKATLQEQIRKSTIRAPFSGVVTAKMTEVGAFAAPGMPLLQITDISTLKFTINVTESELSKFAVNQTYNVIADILPSSALSGRVSMIGSKANLGNSFPVQFNVRNSSDQLIKSGMFGTVKMDGNNLLTDKVIIPSSAIVGSDIKPQVYIAKNNTAYLQDIIIEERVGDQVIVSKGLSVGDILIIGGFINLHDGAGIKIS